MRCLKIALSLIAASYGQDDTCNLKCRNGTPCVKGSADFSDHPTYLDGQPLEFHKEVHQNKMHCACSHGLTGITCDRIYVSCDGNHKCYNGGECIPGIVDNYGNEQLFCDCSRAFDESGNPYVGKFCEHLSKENCGSEERFCVNDGECNDDSSAESPCICMDDFVGPHCEFKKGSVSSCSLDCKNGGQCQFGIPPEASKYHDLDHMFLTNDSNAEDLMYCICPDNFSGKMCEIESEKCGSDMCYNGGKCVIQDAETGSPNYECDCSTANNSRMYSGRFCQFPATSTCDADDSSSSTLFCVNNGRCPTDGSKVCKCDDNFYGIHCEYMDDPEDSTAVPSFSPSTVASIAPDASEGNPTEGNLPTEVPATSAPVEGQLLSVGPSITPNLDTGDPQPTPAEVTFEPPVTNDPQPSPTGDISEPPVTNDPQPSPAEITFDPPVTNDPQPTPAEITFDPPVTNDPQPTPTEVTFEPPVTAPVPSITTESPDSNVCKLSCKNSGICRKGQKSLGIIESIAMFIPELNKTSNSDFEHCECPTGFVGLQCEHLMQVCPGRKHVCLHGSKCVNYGEEQICDCRTGDHQLAGRSCQHKSYTSCNTDETEFVQPRSFCVNGGICLKLVSGNQDHPGCECPFEEWTGPHCELHKSTAKTVDDTSTSLNSNLQEQNNSSQSAILAFGILSLISAIVVSIFTYHREKRNRQKWMREISSNTAPSAPQVNIGPPRDEDGNELHQINIL